MAIVYICYVIYFVAVAEFVEQNDETSDCEMPDYTVDEDYGTLSAIQLVRRRGQENFMTDRLLATLDYAKISSRKAVHLLIATVESLGLSADNYSLNHTTIHNMRTEYRVRESEEIAADFRDNV